MNRDLEKFRRADDFVDFPAKFFEARHPDPGAAGESRRSGRVNDFAIPQVNPDVRHAMLPEPAMLGAERLQRDNVARLDFL